MDDSEALACSSMTKKRKVPESGSKTRPIKFQSTNYIYDFPWATNSSRGTAYAQCILCQCTISIKARGRSSLQDHEKRQKHIDAAAQHTESFGSYLQNWDAIDGKTPRSDGSNSSTPVMEHDDRNCLQTPPQRKRTTCMVEDINAESDFGKQSPAAPKHSTKKQRVSELMSKESELLSLACKYLEESREPEESVPNIAKVWGEKLLSLDQEQRLFAEKAINDVLFEASLGNLHRYSVKINEDSYY